MLLAKRQNLFPPFATTFDGDPAECSKHLGRARGILSLMCRSIPPVKSRTETQSDGTEIQVTTNPNHVYISGGSQVYITYTDWKNIHYTSINNNPPYNWGRRDRFVHQDRKLITVEPTPLDPPNRAMALPRFNPVVKETFYAGKSYWISRGKDRVISWYKDTVFSDGMISRTIINSNIICCYYDDKLLSFIIVHRDTILNKVFLLILETLISVEIELNIITASFLNTENTIIASCLEYPNMVTRKIMLSEDYLTVTHNDVIETHDSNNSTDCMYYVNKGFVICAYATVSVTIEPDSDSNTHTETFIELSRGYIPETSTYWKRGYWWHTNSDTGNHGFIVQPDEKSYTSDSILTILKIDKTGLVTSNNSITAKSSSVVSRNSSSASNPYYPSGVECTWFNFQTEDEATCNLTSVAGVDEIIGNSSYTAISNSHDETIVIYSIMDIDKIFYSKEVTDSYQQRLDSSPLVSATGTNSSKFNTYYNNSVLDTRNNQTSTTGLGGGTASIGFVSGAFDGVLAIGCYQYNPYTLPEEPYTIIVNTKTLKTQILDYRVDLDGVKSHSLSVTTLPKTPTP